MKLAKGNNGDPILWGAPMVYVRPVKAYEPLWALAWKALDTDDMALNAEDDDVFGVLQNVWAVRDSEAVKGWSFYTTKNVEVL